jgi:rhomboid protease GluP
VIDESNTAAIECRSHAQAMDWSLVLISQGIESVIGQQPEDGRWLLKINPHDEPRAREAIAVYQRENKRVWRREVQWAGLLFDARAGFWFATLAIFYFFDTTSPQHLKSLGAVDRDYVLRGEWWRVFTATTLHADIAHLAANCVIGFVFLGLAMGCFGAGNAFLLSVIGGALANVVSLSLHDEPFRSLGASGMVMASLGLLTAHSAVVDRHENRVVWLGRGAAAGCLLVVLMGLSPSSDITAHVAGFGAGVILGIIVMPLRSALLRPITNLMAFLVCILLLLLTWWLALK